MAALIAITLVLAGCAATRPPPRPSPAPAPSADAESAPAKKPQRTPVYQRGNASYYASSFQGQETASGEPFDSGKLTAAHRRLPLGTRVRVTNLDNGRSVVVLINDRGPYADDRILDLSRRAAKRLGMIEDGTAPVKLQILKNR